MDQQAESEEGIDPWPFGGVLMEGEMLSDFIESRVSGFGSME